MKLLKKLDTAELQKLVDDAFLKADVDKSGWIEYGELSLLRDAMGLSDSRLYSLMQDLIVYFDANGDGKLSKEEVKALSGTFILLNSLSQARSKIELSLIVHDLFETLDDDGNGVLEISEVEFFLRFMRSFLSTSEKSVSMIDILTLLDTDGDGEITKEEFLSFFSL
ncbi:hypothetical protein ADUPG1_002536 [Aduncisulcus paluster]|uniref:EF-hand domain-containing protein n=1 Tax=Aduncisulcus paluster TaxID=2918883 RepID=A0ABQ5KM54_9EUKA|nr:hypothetical protein ADUPG1_002536 [Aduncisulcus paluster]